MFCKQSGTGFNRTNASAKSLLFPATAGVHSFAMFAKKLAKDPSDRCASNANTSLGVDTGKLAAAAAALRAVSAATNTPAWLRWVVPTHSPTTTPTFPFQSYMIEKTLASLSVSILHTVDFASTLLSNSFYSSPVFPCFPPAPWVLPLEAPLLQSLLHPLPATFERFYNQ